MVTVKLVCIEYKVRLWEEPTVRKKKKGHKINMLNQSQTVKNIL